MVESMFGRVRICLNGHIVKEEKVGKLGLTGTCRICGARTIARCQSCGREITGNNVAVCGHGSGVQSLVPECCRYCGSPFPWSVNMLSIERFFDFSDLKRDKFLDFSDIVIKEEMSD